MAPGQPPGDETEKSGPDAATDPAFEAKVDPFDPAPTPAPLPQAAIDAIASAVQATLNRASYTKSVRIENASTEQTIATVTSTRLLKPASNTKLFTSAAALGKLGEDHGLALRAYGPNIAADGTLTGDLHVLSSHDFSLSSEFYPGPRVPFDRLAQVLGSVGLKTITGGVFLDGEVLYEGQELGALDVAAHRAKAIGPLGDALTAAGIAHGAVTSTANLTAPAGMALLAEYAPIPITVGISPLNTLSHNEFADMLSRMLGFEIGKTSSYAAGGKVMIDWAASLAVPTEGLVFNDGSGLSGNNRASADAIVALMKGMAGTPLGLEWRRSMSIAGVRGTFGGRLGDADTKGRYFAKSGTLNDTICSSGYLENRYDGQEYLISILQNAVTSQSAARGIADDVVRAVARNHRRSADRLSPPVLMRVRGGAAAKVLEIAWKEVPGADGYLVWLSPDGRVWSRSNARFVKSTRFIAGDVLDSPQVFVRVTAHDASGLESDPSVTMTAAPTKERADVLFVDANERWHNEPSPKNVLSAHHDFLVGLAEASKGRRVDTVSHHEIIDATFDLSPYRVVVWAAGETSLADKPLAAPEQEALTTYLAKGGSVVFSGSELLFYLSKGADADRDFASNVMHAALADDTANTSEFEGTKGTPFEKVAIASFYTPDAMTVATPDLLTPQGGATELLHYIGGKTGAAAVGFKDKGRVVVTGFPLESISSGAMRKSVMDAVYGYFEL